MRNFAFFFVAALLLTGCIGSFLLPVFTSGDAERGAQIFTQGHNQSPPCSTCHYVASGQTGFTLGPNLAGIAQRAGTRVEGLSAAQYLHQSIVDPHRYVVSGYREIMYPSYAQHFTERDIQDLIAYMLTLEV